MAFSDPKPVGSIWNNET